MTQFVKWSNEEGEVVGILELVGHDTLTIKTSTGIITIPKDDGIVTDITEEEYNNTPQQSTEVEEIIVDISKGDKMAMCVAIYNRMKSAQPKPGEVIKQFQSEVNISKQHSSTYYYSIKKKEKEQNS